MKQAPTVQIGECGSTHPMSRWHQSHKRSRHDWMTKSQPGSETIGVFGPGRAGERSPAAVLSSAVA
jgi:hypothetical protein